MDLGLSDSKLAFLLCEITPILAAFFIWLVGQAEQSPLLAHIQAKARRRLNLD